MRFYGLTEEHERDLTLRRERLTRLMCEMGGDALIATSNVNLYYLTGRLPDAYFYLTPEGNCRLFLRRPQTWEGEGITNIKHPGEIPALLAGMNLPVPRRLMLEAELPYVEHRRIASCFPLAEILAAPLREARMIKTSYEQTILRKTGSWHVQTQAGVPELYHVGMTDVEFDVAICNHFRENGHPGFFRIAGHRMEAPMGTVLAGDNACVPSPFDFALGGAGYDHLPFAVCGIPLNEGMSVMVDVSGNRWGYNTDMTRVYSIGELPRQALNLHEIALEIQAAFVASAAPGVRCCDLYNQALDIARRSGFLEYFMGCSQHAKFVGHSLGLEINEMPVIAPRDATKLLPGMVFAYEPKFTLPGVGAVGIENTFLVTEAGVERLTPGDDAVISL